MSISTAVAFAALVAVSDARFGQEGIPADAVRQLGDAGFGEPGVAATVAGSIPGALLGGANPCEQLTIADQIIDELGTDQAVVDAAIGLVSAEKNFNPFQTDIPSVCADATLPVNAQLRGITPLVDPAVDGSDVANAASKKSVTLPFDAEGLSQADVLAEQGFTNFTAVDSAGANVNLPAQGGIASGGGASEDDASDDGASDDGASDDGASDDGASDDGASDDGASDDGAPSQEVPPQCGGGIPNNGTHNGTGNGNQGNQGNNGNNTGDEANSGDDDATGGGAGTLDFGLCQPSMARVGGLNGRPADEFTFIPQDPLVAEGQQEALNPNIITNRICDQLINVCEADEDAIAACEDAQAQIEALGTRDQSTADTWNALLGFDGVDSTVGTI